MPVLPQRPCPCGASSYDACCGRLHRGEAAAATPEELMRSRYSAYAVGETGYVFRTWHPRTRPPDLDPDVAPEPGLRWTGLEILDAPDSDGETGAVEFRATYEIGLESRAGAGVLHEHSRFARRAGRWLYLDGQILSDQQLSAD